MLSPFSPGKPSEDAGFAPDKRILAYSGTAAFAASVGTALGWKAALQVGPS